MATKTPDAETAAAPPPKSKKMLILALVGVLVVALAVAGGWIFLSKKNAVDDEDAETEDSTSQQVTQPSGPPVYLPLENMVVNLADPGGERVAQIGVTFELTSTSATEAVKAYLPTIRSGILMLISQRTADELLTREGKEQLAADILAESSRHFGGPAASKKDAKKSKKPETDQPMRAVLFSSFIVQ